MRRPSIGDGAEEQLRTAESEDIGQKKKLDLVVLDIVCVGDVGEGRQQDVDRQRVQRHQPRDDGDEFTSWNDGLRERFRCVCLGVFLHGKWRSGYSAASERSVYPASSPFVT